MRCRFEELLGASGDWAHPACMAHNCGEVRQKTYFAHQAKGGCRMIPEHARKWEYSLPASAKSEDLMAVFKIYADDSGKFDNLKCDYTSLCGYVGHASEWARFSLEWDNCRFRWGVPPVHMSPIMHPERDTEWLRIKDDWGKDWEARRDLMLGDFAATVRSAQIVCIGAVVDAAYFRSLPDSQFKQGAKDSLFLAFHDLVMRGIEKTEIVDPYSSISLVIDDDRSSAMRCYEMLDMLKQTFPKVRERIHGICFVNDKSYPGIQAADMIAYESRRLMVERIKDPNVVPSELFSSLTLLLIHQPKLYTPAVLDILQTAAPP